MGPPGWLSRKRDSRKPDGIIQGCDGTLIFVSRETHLSQGFALNALLPLLMSSPKKVEGPVPPGPYARDVRKYGACGRGGTRPSTFFKPHAHGPC
jgi:hypothetical protein